jgi:anti-sigma B factor antagonist
VPYPLHRPNDFPRCTVAQQWSRRTVVVSVSGTVDLCTVGTLQDSITATLQSMPDALVVDLTEVDFLAARGIGVLCSATAHVPSGVRFAVVANSPVTRRPMTLVGLPDTITVYASRDEALGAIAA